MRSIKRALHALLETRVGVDDKPLLAHPSVLPVSILMIHASVVSTANRNSAMTTTNANTIAGRLHRFLARRPRHAAGFRPRFLREREEFLARAPTATRRPPAATSPPSTISTRSTCARLGEVVVAPDAGNDARHRERDLCFIHVRNQEPGIRNRESRATCASRLTNSAFRLQPFAPTALFAATSSDRCCPIDPKVAGQEGIEPPTCGFGDRRSAN